MEKRDRTPEAADARRIYGDIIDRAHHVSSRRPPMPRRNRAAQFAPFAALTGYDELIRESERETDARRELEEDELQELNRRLLRLLQAEEAPEALFTVFEPDGKKAGGRYVTLRGRIARFSEADGAVTLDSGAELPIENIVRIECEAVFRDPDE